MISFYPGPSRVHDEIPAYVKDAHKLGIMSINHRSEDFIAMSKKTISLLKAKLSIPKNYTIFFTSSATECWEIIAQSIVHNKSYHLYNGAFGQKWFEYTKRIQSGAEGFVFGREEAIDVKRLQVSDNAVICLTQNETSNGTQVTNTIIRSIKKKFPKNLLAIDATSSMAGIKLDFKAADIWYASVQKCFGLPAGLALLICSPEAVEKAKLINEKNHYNSFTFMLEMMEKWQTPFTPNVLGIYLLMRVLEKSNTIEHVESKIKTRYEAWEKFFQTSHSIQLLIKNKKVRSFTVVPLQGATEVLAELKAKAKASGILLGEGYGELKQTTFRIANFPAIKEKEIGTLKAFLKKRL